MPPPDPRLYVALALPRVSEAESSRSRSSDGGFGEARKSSGCSAAARSGRNRKKNELTIVRIAAILSVISREDGESIVMHSDREIPVRPGSDKNTSDWCREDEEAFVPNEWRKSTKPVFDYQSDDTVRMPTDSKRARSPISRRSVVYTRGCLEPPMVPDPIDR